MKRFLMLVALASVLSPSALAGDIPSVPGPQSTPGTPSQAISLALGDMPTGGELGEVPMVDSDAALSALLTLLGLAV